MARKSNTGTFKAGNKSQRGKSFKTKMLDALREVAKNEHALVEAGDKDPEDVLVSVPKGAKTEAVEKIFMTHLMERVIDKADPASMTLLTHVLNKSYPSLKQVSPEVKIAGFPHDGTAAEKAIHIMSAISAGAVPPDTGALIIQALKNTIDIEESTDLKQRIIKLEEALNERSS